MLWAGASALVLALYLAFFGALSWGVGRLSRRWDDDVAAAGRAGPRGPLRARPGESRPCPSPDPGSFPAQPDLAQIGTF